MTPPYKESDKFQFIEQMKTAPDLMDGGCAVSYTDAGSILDGDLVALCDAVCSMECKESYGDHLAADGAGFAGGQVAVVAVLQIYADLLRSLHFELLHS